MATYVQSLSLDVAGKNLYKYVYAKQGDNGSRFVNVTMVANGTKVVPAAGNTAKIRAQKPDGTGVYNPATINNDGTITAELTEQMLAVKGEVKADIMLLGANDQILSTATFIINVEEAPAGRAITSSNEFLELVELRSVAIEAAEAAEAAQTAAEAAAALANSAAGSITQLYYPTGSVIGSLTKGSTINNSGVAYNNTKRARTALRSRNSGTTQRLAVSLDLNGYEYAVALYTRPSSISDGTGFIGYQDINGGSWTTGMTIISTAADNFVLAFRHKVSGTEQTITDADISAIEAALVVYASTDQTVSTPGVPADAKATGERFGVLEDATFFWASISPSLSRGRITNTGEPDSYGARCHTTYLWNARKDGEKKRYKVRFTSMMYAMRIAMYGENGSYASPTDFIGWLNSSNDSSLTLAEGTGTFDIPENCKMFGLDFRKAGSESALTTADYDAIRAGLSVYTNTDTTLSLAGCAADAKAVRDFIAPELTASQKRDILDLVDAYYAIRENVVYRYVTTRNSFVTKAGTFDENNKLQLCCTAFTQLVWGGVDPSTFADPSTYDGTIVKAFDWGYFLKFLIRQRTDGLAIRENGVVTGEYGYRSTNGYEHGWSFNSRYDAEGTWPNSQKPRTALNASDIACELFNNGYEIPLRYADVGDMVFYEEIPSGMTEYYSNAFRRIDHGSIIIGKSQGFFEVAEVTSINGGNPPVVKRSIFSENDFFAAKSGYMASRIVMVARHPAAFGVSGNVPNKFTTVNGRA